MTDYEAKFIFDIADEENRNAVAYFLQSVVRHRGAIDRIAARDVSTTYPSNNPYHGAATVLFTTLKKPTSVPAKEKAVLEEYRDVNKQALHEYGINPFAVDLLVESQLLKAVPVVCFRVKHRDGFYKVRIEREE